MPSAGLEPHRAVSWAVAAGLALLGWVGAAGLFSSAPLFGLWLLTHLRVHGECASAQSLQAVGLNIICLWFSGPDTHPATEGWVRVRGCMETGVACKEHWVPQSVLAGGSCEARVSS